MVPLFARRRYSKPAEGGSAWVDGGLGGLAEDDRCVASSSYYGVRACVTVDVGVQGACTREHPSEAADRLLVQEQRPAAVDGGGGDPGCPRCLIAALESQTQGEHREQEADRG